LKEKRTPKQQKVSSKQVRVPSLYQHPEDHINYLSTKINSSSHVNENLKGLEAKLTAAIMLMKPKNTDTENNSSLMNAYQVELRKEREIYDQKDIELTRRQQQHLNDSQKLVTCSIEKLLTSSSEHINKVTEACTADRSWIVHREDNARQERENAAQRLHIERLKELELLSQERAAQERESQRTERDKALLASQAAIANRPTCSLM
jgi:hypothetical protein